MNYYTIYEKLLISLYFLCHRSFFLFSANIWNISLFCKFLGFFFCVFVRKDLFCIEIIGDVYCFQMRHHKCSLVLSLQGGWRQHEPHFYVSAADELLRGEGERLADPNIPLSLQNRMEGEGEKKDWGGVTVVTVVTVFSGGVYELGLLSNCFIIFNLLYIYLYIISYL